MNLVEPIDIRTGKPFDSRRQHLHHRPSIDGASIAGYGLVTGRARGLMGGAFMGAMLAQQSSMPPIPYKKRVAYLESNGDAWINTGIIPTLDDVISSKFNLFNSPFRASPFGSYTSTTVDGVFVRVYSSNTKIEAAFISQNAGYGGISFDVELNNDHEIELSHGSATFDGITKTNRQLTTVPSLPLYLFTMNFNGNPQQLNHVRVYSFKVARNGNDVMRLIPVVDNNGRPTMYDEVGGQFYYNQGSGEFTWAEL